MGDNALAARRVISRGGLWPGRVQAEADHRPISPMFLRSDRLFLPDLPGCSRATRVPYDDMLVDAAAYNLVVNPQRFDVLVTPCLRRHPER